MRPAAPHVLVMDLGTTSLRCSIVDPNGTVCAWRQSVVPASRDGDGLTWDGLGLARQALAEAGALAAEWPVAGLAIANQRTTALIWEAASGRPCGPVLSWSDGRTREMDRTLRKRGIRLVPGLSASKWRWLLDRADPEGRLQRAGALRAGTLESWLVWNLSGGAAHVSDHVNASHSGLFDLQTGDWDAELARELDFHPSLLPRLCSCLPAGITASALPGAPRILAMIGDQQASLVGQGCVAPGMAKITFGTSGVLNMVVGTDPFIASSHAAFGNVALSTPDGLVYGAESAVMSVGSAVEWLVRLGVLSDSAAIDRVVVPSDRGSAVFVAALDGLGVPHWDSAARGAFFGLSAATGPGELVRAVLDGIVAGTVEIIAQLEGATGRRLDGISIDGGLTRSNAFCAILAVSIDRRLRRSPVNEATTLGGAMLAQRALGLPPAPCPPGELLSAPAGTMSADLAAWQDAVALTLQHTRTRRSGFQRLTG